MKPMTTISAPDDLLAFWEMVDGGDGYSVPQLFAILLDGDGTVLPTIINIKDFELQPERAALPEVPISQMVDGLTHTLGQLLGSHTRDGSVAVMRARPGNPQLSADDRDWCRALHRSLMAAPFRSEPLYFASNDGPRMVAAEDLMR